MANVEAAKHTPAPVYLALQAALLANTTPMTSAALQLLPWTRPS